MCCGVSVSWRFHWLSNEETQLSLVDSIWDSHMACLCWSRLEDEQTWRKGWSPFGHFFVWFPCMEFKLKLIAAFRICTWQISLGNELGRYKWCCCKTDVSRHVEWLACNWQMKSMYDLAPWSRQWFWIRISVVYRKFSSYDWICIECLSTKENFDHLLCSIKSSLSWTVYWC